MNKKIKQIILNPLGIHFFKLAAFAVLIGGLLIWNLPSNGSETAAPPYPSSQLIRTLFWAPASEIIRLAPGSDNWPMTWADDDALYTAYGDGWGFEDIDQTTKLSLGFSMVTGPGSAPDGFDIDSNGEQIGQGELGKKASGLLMVDGTLYMWVRNVANGEGCQLAMSSDHAQTWNWSSWIFPEFGYCTFINFGKNYAWARDSYVYMVTHDNPSAYNPADDFILTRVPADKIMNRGDYQFFTGINNQGNPTWSADISARKPVFTHVGKSRRSGITYNAGLGRYIWWQGIPDERDERLEGGFGVYEAPEPWGPWSTIYFVDNWDVGPGETASFPTKWMSGDGLTMYLVFSGDDYFSVRKATINLRSGSLDNQVNLPVIRNK